MAKRPLYLRTSEGPAAHALLSVFGECVEILGPVAPPRRVPPETCAEAASLGEVIAIHKEDRVPDYQETGLRVWRHVDYLDVPTGKEGGLACGQYVRLPADCDKDNDNICWYLADEVPDRDGWTRFVLQKYG